MIYVASGYTGSTYPIANPRVCAFPWTGTVTPSTEATGFAAINAMDGQTWTYWKPTAAPANWDLFPAAAQDVNYVGIAAHNIGTVGGTVFIQKWNGTAWVGIVSSQSPTDDSPMLFLFPTVNLDRIRVRITAAIPTIGVIMAGVATEFPQKASYVGAVPFDEAEQPQFADTISEGGHVLERFLLRKAVPAQMTIPVVDEPWARATLFPLSVHLQDAPAFFADRPADVAQSVVFGRLAEPLVTPRARPVAGAARAVTLKINGFAA